MSNRPHVRGVMLDPKKPAVMDPELAQRVSIGQQTLMGAVQAHLSGEPAMFEFAMPKHGVPVQFRVTIEVVDAEDS